MQILTGNRFDNTMLEWKEMLAKAEKRLADSTKCQELFGDHEEWVKEDQEKVNRIREQMKTVEANMRARGWKPSSEM